MGDLRLDDKPQNASERIQDRAIRRNLLLEGAKNLAVARALDRLRRASGFSIREFNKLAERARSLAHLRQLLAPIIAARVDGLYEGEEPLIRDVARFTTQEADHHYGLLLIAFAGLSSARKSMMPQPTPLPPGVAEGIASQSFVGHTPKGWLGGIGARLRKDTDKAIRAGVAADLEPAGVLVRVRLAVEASTRSLALLTRTMLTAAIASTRSEVYSANDGMLDGWMWNATLDASTCLECALLDGETFPVGGGDEPPAHASCLPGDALVATVGRISGSSERWYEGPLVHVRSRSGVLLRATPNHPVLTSRGWVPVGRLQKGDHLIRYLGDVHVLDEEVKNVQARIQQVARSVGEGAQVVPVAMPLSAEDFHGDVPSHHQVAVVRSHGQLMDDFVAPAAQLLAKLGLLPRVRLAGGLLGGGPLALLGAGGGPAATGRVRRADLRCPDGRLHASPLDRLLLRRGAKSHAPRTQDSVDGPAGDPEVARDLVRGVTGPVAMDDVISVEIQEFRGHVYNLQTETGWYCSSGIVVHNCRCFTTPILLGDVPPNRITYPDWLARQEAHVQDEALGSIRGALFREGGLQISDFVNREGVQLRLGDLRRREPDAFDRAGV